jgi:CPA1 family monovalent cation:H+ antiporter
VATCLHLAENQPIPAADSAGGCTDCLREGTRWVHLRQCTDCGHVACCDSSPRQHATAHYYASNHPVVRSYEPGEAWRWCYVDQQIG